MSEERKRRLIARIAEAREFVWLFCGDSITHGAAHTLGWRDYVQHVAERVRYEKGRGLHIFVNSAISGNTTREIKSQFDHRIRRFQPDVFFLMIGMNDCADKRAMTIEEFESNLNEIVARVRAETPAEVVLQTCCAIHPELTPERARYPLFMDAVRRVAKEADTVLIDHYSAWEKVRQTDRALFDAWMANAFHPNALGHWVFAERILKELEIGPLEKCPAPSGPQATGRE